MFPGFLFKTSLYNLILCDSRDSKHTLAQVVSVRSASDAIRELSSKVKLSPHLLRVLVCSRVLFWSSRSKITSLGIFLPRNVAGISHKFRGSLFEAN